MKSVQNLIKIDNTSSERERERFIYMNKSLLFPNLKSNATRTKNSPQ